ncbi:AAA domain-containing protein [Mucilaginibacter sp. SJ]|uniref:AAA domain-containing protein n=1 Tax=Mucilaginibacter sp. SJ TaxID=3029053 RepID=UPI0023A980AC|nr:AAA domain-containing protein [Mucilaginibacter sp. SJ]WEA02536.1 AAA domain-containing protein [Mucilaginibacter sp. SJ]
MDYFKKLLSLLQTEQDEDRQAYLKLTETSSTAERRAAGLTWYPIAIKSTEIGRGDYLTVEVERPSYQDLSHQFRFGASAALFSNHDPKTDRVNGTVSYQGGNRLKLTLNTDELPDWTRNGKLGIDLLFDDNSYDEMQKALKLSARLVDDHKEGHLTRVLTGQSTPAFIPETIHYPLNGLNTSQLQAVQKIIEAQELAVVHGPPGTGKTTTLVQAIKALIRQNKQQILVVAPSNTAVDLLSEKLSNEGLNVLRIGNPARVSERLMALTLDSRISAHSDMKEIKKLKKQASEYKNMAHKYKRNFGKAERDQRKALFDAAHQLIKEVDKTEQFITEDLLAKAQIITATLVGANHYTIRNLKFHTVVIDEAGQALEPACWIPISKAQKVIFAGDHLQLPPTIKSQQAAKDGLSSTLLEKCVALHPESVILLEEQYRMNEAIMGFSSKEFYGNRLKAHSTVAHQLLFPGDVPLSFVDTAGCGFDEKQEGTSTTNPEEAAFLFKHLHKLVSELTGAYSTENFPTIAIISPYKEQIRILNQLLLDSPELLIYADKIAVNTIDSFQGQERDVVYISLTRSNTNGEIGFLNDIRRMNVAMTRARKKLVMIGDSSTLAFSAFYADMISYAEQLNGYQSAWDYAGYD